MRRNRLRARVKQNIWGLAIIIELIQQSIDLNRNLKIIVNKYPFLLCSSVEVVGILSDRGLPGPRAIQVHFQELLLHKEALQIHFNKVFIKLFSALWSFGTFMIGTKNVQQIFAYLFPFRGCLQHVSFYSNPR